MTTIETHKLTENGRKNNNVRVLTFRLSWTTGIERIISPPPWGGTPRLSIFSSSPSGGTPNRFNMGKVADLNVSTEGSLESFVIPERSRQFK